MDEPTWDVEEEALININDADFIFIDNYQEVNHEPIQFEEGEVEVAMPPQTPEPVGNDEVILETPGPLAKKRKRNPAMWKKTIDKVAR